MKIRTSLWVFAGLALLISTGCSAQKSTPAVPLAPAAQRSAQSFGGALAYVADPGNNAIYVFRADVNNPKRLATISDPNTPFGLALDAHGNLFVADTNAGDIAVYKAGTTTLLRTLDFPESGPMTLAFNPHGVLFVVDSLGLVAEYPPGKTSPSQTFSLKRTTSINSIGQIAFDAAGNLYAAVVPRIEKPAHVFKFAPGATLGVDLNLDIKNNSTQPGLAFDPAGNLYIGNYEDVDVFAPGSREPSGQIGQNEINPVAFLAIGKSGDVYLPRRDIVTPEGVRNGYVLEYGSGGSPLIARINNVVNPVAVAVSATAP